MASIGYDKKSDGWGRVGGTLIWVLLLLMLLPEYHSIALSDSLREGAYVIVLIALFGIASFFFLTIPFGQIHKLISRSPYLLLLCIWIVFSQLILGFRGEVELYEVIRAFSYAGVSLSGFLVFPLIFFYDRSVEKQWWLCLVVIAIFASVLGVVTVFVDVRSILGIDVGREQYMRMLGIPGTRSFFRQRTAFGMQALVGYVGTLYFLSRRNRSWLVLVSAAVCLSGIFHSWGRGVWLATVVTTAVWLFVGSSRRRKTLILIGMMLILFALYRLLFSSPLLAEMAILERGMSGRENTWPLGIQAILERPLGYGFGKAFDVKYSMAWGRIPITRISESGFHNFLLDSGISAGIPAMVLNIAVVITSLSRLRYAWIDVQMKRVVSAGALGILTVSFFTTYSIGGVRNPSFVMTVLLGLANASPWLWRRGES